MSKSPENAIIFRLICSRPQFVLWISLLFIAISGFGISKVTKNPSVDAFVNSESPIVKARDIAGDIFGVEDPVIIAIMHSQGETLFTPEHLSAFKHLNDRVQTVTGVQADKVRSLATEFLINSDDGELIVDPIIPDGDISPISAEMAWENARLMPVFERLLYSADGSALLIIVPVLDADNAETTLDELKAIKDEFSTRNRDIHIAGVAAMNAQMAQSISRDTRIFVPGCIIVVLSIVFIAVRRIKGMIGPVLVVAGACAAAVGLMGWMGKDYYLVTTVLPVLVVSIAVADSLHILSSYLSIRSKAPRNSAAETMELALRQTWHPVSLTSLTTIAGFIGLSAGSTILPIAEFGWFAAAGVIAAWFLSLTLLPAIVVLTNLQPRERETGSSARLDNLLDRVTKLSSSRPKRVVIAALIGLVILAAIAAMVQFDYARARYFAPKDPILVADEAINERFAGTNIIDVLISAPDIGGIETEDAINAIHQLQNQLTSLPNVQKVSAIADHVSLLHEHLADAPPGTLPTQETAVSQYLFIFEASGGPENLSDRIDFNRQHALLRAHLNEDSFRATLDDVEMAERIVAQWQRRHGLSAQVSGRIPVNASWMKELRTSHPIGVGTAFFLIFLVSIVLFRSLIIAVLSFIPVVFGVTSIYAVMAYLNIDLAPATSMCAAISAGLGIDFGTHIVATLRRQRNNPGIYTDHLPVVARACCYSMLSLSLGLSVTALSAVPALQWYGLFISVGAITAFLSAIVVLPAAFQLIPSLSTHFKNKETSYA